MTLLSEWQVADGNSNMSTTGQLWFTIPLGFDKFLKATITVNSVVVKLSKLAKTKSGH